MVKLKKEQLYILPDKILVISGGKIGAIDTNSLVFKNDDIRFIEEDRVPSDAVIIDYTWKYVNKNGSPDKRFKNNRQLPVCRYGRLEIKSIEGLNILIQCSDINKVINFSNLYNDMILKNKNVNANL